MKYVSSGIFSQYMPLRRICRKIEQIIREEMDKIDGQEVLMPVMMPSSIWEILQTVCFRKNRLSSMPAGCCRACGKRRSRSSAASETMTAIISGTIRNE